MFEVKLAHLTHPKADPRTMTGFFDCLAYSMNASKLAKSVEYLYHYPVMKSFEISEISLAIFPSP